MDSLRVMIGDARLLLRFGGAISLRIWSLVRVLSQAAASTFVWRGSTPPSISVSPPTFDYIWLCRWQPRANPARIAWHPEEQHGIGTRRLSYLVQLCARRRGACRA